MIFVKRKKSFHELIWPTLKVFKTLKKICQWSKIISFLFFTENKFPNLKKNPFQLLNWRLSYFRIQAESSSRVTTSSGSRKFFQKNRICCILKSQFLSSREFPKSSRRKVSRTESLFSKNQKYFSMKFWETKKSQVMFSHFRLSSENSPADQSWLTCWPSKFQRNFFISFY